MGKFAQIAQHPTPLCLSSQLVAGICTKQGFNDACTLSSKYLILSNTASKCHFMVKTASRCSSRQTLILSTTHLATLYSWNLVSSHTVQYPLDAFNIVLMLLIVFYPQNYRLIQSIF